MHQLCDHQQTKKQRPKKRKTNKSSVSKTYARAVQEATATIMMQVKQDRTAEDIKRQLVGKVQNQDGVHKEKKIRNSMKFFCESVK